MTIAKNQIFIALLLCITAVAQQPSRLAPQASHLTGPDVPRIETGELFAALKSSNKPLVLQVGMARLYRHSHITGSDYAGPANEPEGLAALRERVQSVAKTTSIVIYCGCCPWEHCPNIQPAYDELHKLGFRKVKALYLPQNFKYDWEDKGYPTASGE